MDTLIRNIAAISAHLEHCEAAKAIPDFKTFLSLCTIWTPDHGEIPLKPNAFQKDFAEKLVEEPRVLAVTARQIGASTLLGLYALWFALKNPGSNIVLTTWRYSPAIEHLEKVRRTIEHLGIKLTKNMKGSIKFENESRIVAKALDESALRGLRIDLLIVLDAAYAPQEPGENFWATVMPHLTFGGRLVLQSALARPEGFFHRLWKEEAMPSFVYPWWFGHEPSTDRWRPYIDEANFKAQFECSLGD